MASVITYKTEADLMTFRVWPRIKRFRPNSDDCWEWQGACSANGYGVFQNANKSISVHRFVWQVFRGPIPNGLQVLHRCDNPKCCNPAHLWLGTQSDNILDCSRKGRLAIFAGEKSPWAKLNNNKVNKIRELLAEGVSQSKIASQFGVVQQTISAIATGRRWKKEKTCKE